RRKHCRLPVLNIHIIDFRQVAYASGDGYITFVFDGTCLSTTSDTGISVLRIGQIWNKQNFHSVCTHYSCKLREFYIMTNNNSDCCAGGVKCLYGVPALHSPIQPFVWSNVHLPVHYRSPVAYAQKTNMIRNTIFQ